MTFPSGAALLQTFHLPAAISSPKMEPTRRCGVHSIALYQGLGDSFQKEQ